ncbi:nucleotide-diphosphate-sugar epimerase [Acrocarpospora pleiomorpha]|uniref:Nucleotide-diphosphate-sugar epimerase n=1 Tax=Acrocarpospora pleiomorpha TaxID=90975 RepID=A0A5M3XFH4_9ACTN|nr:NmrA/HSCARG family protein [Acrocarpospora pleiomorpha]GES18351.1 nucleotide-diphosphate-sugar epimerase [Acrocarpospora pleiomorpha]
MSHDKVITVLGATGTQGGAVARALLADGEFTVRAVTRNAASPKAQTLAGLGADVVEATLTDEGSLRRVFEGAYGAFLVTPYWEHRSPTRELAEVENLISAAQAAGLRHVLWSTLEDTREAMAADDNRMPFVDGYRVPHFDVKGGAADALFAKSGLPTTYLLLSFYWDNLLTLAKPQRDPDGTLAMHLPLGDTPIAGVASDDIGQVALRVLRQPSETIGATIPVVGEYQTGEQMAAALSTVLGEPVAYRPPTHDQFRGFGFPGADELGNMFQYYAEFPGSYLGRRDLEVARVFNPDPLSLTDFLAAHRTELTA